MTFPSHAPSSQLHTSITLGLLSCSISLHILFSVVYSALPDHMQLQACVCSCNLSICLVFISSLSLTVFVRAEQLLHPVRVMPVHVGLYTEHVAAQVVQVWLCEVTRHTCCVLAHGGPVQCLLLVLQLERPGGKRKRERKALNEHG